jgi:hypothetical protein
MESGYLLAYPREDYQTMKTMWRSAIASTVLTAAMLAAFVHPALAQTPPPGVPVLLGTTGACDNAVQGGPCTEKSTLVQVDPRNGALVTTIGPVGFTVNGLAWDVTSNKLYATTAVGDVVFHGLITIDTATGAGTPVDQNVVNFGLPADPQFVGSPIHSISIDSAGNMVGWYNKFPPPVGVTDTFVKIDKATGVATAFDNTGISTRTNGLAFAKHDFLWNINPGTAFLLDPADGKPVASKTLSPPKAAALGDFDPVGNQYFGLNFTPGTATAFLIVVDVKKGTTATVGQTVDDLHTLAFIKHLPQ